MKYEILSHTNKSDLEKVVRSYLKDGWSLQGGAGAAVNPRTEDVYFFQAVSKN